MQTPDLPLDLIKTCMHYAYGYEAYSISELIKLGDLLSLAAKMRSEPDSAQEILHQAMDADNLEIARLAILNGADCKRAVAPFNRPDAGSFGGEIYISLQMLNLFIEFGFDLRENAYLLTMSLMNMIAANTTKEDLLRFLFSNGIAHSCFRYLIANGLAFELVREYDPNYEQNKDRYLEIALLCNRVNMARLLMGDGADLRNIDNLIQELQLIGVPEVLALLEEVLEE